MWQFTGQQRPDFAIEPAEGQESVWDYPRPPAVREDQRVIEVIANGKVIASATRSHKICETASPPTFYLSPDDVNFDLLLPVRGVSVCEWKGTAQYWGLADDFENTVAWSYPEPLSAFSAFRDHVAFYPGRLECYIEGERVKPQPGHFYGGWITSDVVGPFKGDHGTGHW